MSSLTRLLYVASLSAPVTVSEEATLRARFAALNVTGTLVALSGEALGALEGERPDVLNAYELLAQHESHSLPEIIEVEDIEAQEFPDWTVIRPGRD